MCSPRELKRMILDRGLVDPYPSGTTMKYTYVRTLTKADRSPLTFRLLDLPAEMRNLIYIELLTFPADRCREHRFCFPQILRTCRQVHKEAEELLYTENTISCDFKTRYTKLESYVYPETSAFIHNKELNHYDCFFNFQYGSDLQLTDPSDGSGNRILRKFLLRLASALMDQNKMESLCITISDDVQSEERPGTADILHPMRRLRNIPKVSIRGKVGATTALQIVTDIKGDSPTFNTVKQLQLILLEAEAYQNLHGSINCTVKVDKDDLLLSSRTSTTEEIIGHHVRQIQIMLDPEYELAMFADEEAERYLQIRLAKIKSCLDGVQEPVVAKRLKALEATRTTRLSYTKETAPTSIDLKALERARTPSPFLDEDDLF
ncbi:uncharacterized protein RCC_01065 [Ramularia collo-cygni]|uniref:F-box domain-containing protein n=1 Tax=Ramularia collo-cygni TaxID=112498 RepID=A0A2D3URR4_9PEZI|nr:uncharacterized protein RCC_01065 [Ramularia collo-cygni]CZT15180.1 uncharacterized protein RCC_01065 [Ramularia collo-cygni]